MPFAELAELRSNVPLAPFTTLGIGGPARWFAPVRNVEDALAAQRWADERSCPLFVLGGGSNLVVSDAGFDGLVLHVDFRGCDLQIRGGELHVDAAAGEPWDSVVARTVEAGFAGLECLSGIPGSVGGTPVQNVGAYGQDIQQSLESVLGIDRTTGQLVQLAASECGFSYRQSRFKTRDRDRFIITGVHFRLHGGPPVPAYHDVVALIKRLGIQRPSVADVRRAILDVRRSKGMVLDAGDPDTRSAGSFFMNPLVDSSVYAGIARVATARGERSPGFPQPDGRVKVPAAWLIERSGLSKGQAHGRAGLSSKHPLAIINRGEALAREIVDLAAFVKRRVLDTFGVWLQPEPVFVGFGDDDTISFLRKADG